LDGGTVIKDPLALSIKLARDERLYMSRWLALEILMNDEAVCEDTELYDRLSNLQDKFEQETLAKYGAA
jgi:hypothetical protein